MSIPVSPNAPTSLPEVNNADPKKTIFGRSITWIKDLDYRGIATSTRSLMIQTAKAVFSVAFASWSMINCPLTFIGALIGGVLFADTINAGLRAVKVAVLEKANPLEKVAFGASLFFAMPLALVPQFRVAAFGLYNGAEVAARDLPAKDKPVKA